MDVAFDLCETLLDCCRSTSCPLILFPANSCLLEVNPFQGASREDENVDHLTGGSQNGVKRVSGKIFCSKTLQQEGCAQYLARI